MRRLLLDGYFEADHALARIKPKGIAILQEILEEDDEDLAEAKELAEMALAEMALKEST